MNFRSGFAAAAVLSMLSLGSPSFAHESPETGVFPVTHGVAAGDVYANRATIWSRTFADATMHVLLESRNHKPLHQLTHVSADDDYTGKITVTDLRPNTTYRYHVWFTDDEERRHKPREGVESGTFTTPPAARARQAISFAWGGDLAGQNVCRDREEGFPIFRAINRLKLDFFIGLGDMIYADGTCGTTGRYGNAQIAGDFARSATMKDFWAHWKYSREDAGLSRLLAKLPYYAVWDDHEVVNDFGPLHDTRNAQPYTPGEHLLPKGLRAYLNYNPLAENPDTPHRLYRNVRWGKHLEVFFLDNRQYRDANLEADDDALKKTMLGREQLAWLTEKIKASDATWKVIVSSVPISIPTGFPAAAGRDGWSNYDQDTGFENEISDILTFLRDNSINNVVFLTTDVHFAEVFRYTPFAETSDFQVHEFVTGPLNAGLFPNRAFDPTLGSESLFFYGPESFDSVTTWEQARPWMNFGKIDISEEGVLSASVRNIDGKVVYEMQLAPR